MLRRKFKLLEKLGKGTYSNVYKVKRISDGKFYALKKVRLPKLNKKGLTIFIIITIYKKK